MSGIAKETIRLKAAIVNQMRITDCLTDLQVKQLLRCHVTTSKPLNRNDELLRITESLDDAKRREFLLCLRQNDQNSTVKLFVKGGSKTSNSFDRRNCLIELY